MDKDFIVHADHGSNASAFAARVYAGTQADLHSAITTGISVLSGPSHGGAAENVMKMVKEVGSPENAKDYVKIFKNQVKGLWVLAIEYIKPKTLGHHNCKKG